MIKIFRTIFLFTLLGTAVTAAAQNTSTSPYSQFGLGDLNGSYLPQTRGMAGISMGVRKPGLYDNVNLANPASYSSFLLTTFDIGASMDFRKLSKEDISGKRQFNSTLSHITFGIPVSRSSAISFGLVPYSDLGYQYKNMSMVDTTEVEYVFGGEGGVSKAYFGYGLSLGKNLSIGFNVAYLFGSLKQSRAIQFMSDDYISGYDQRAFHSRTEYQHSVGGMSYDLGLQYSATIGENTKLILGYTGNTGHDLRSQRSIVTTRYKKDVLGDDLSTADSTFYEAGVKTSIKMPVTHTAGFAIEKSNSWLIGADVSYSKWSDYREGDVNPGLNDSFGIALGGQFTPDPSSISSYLDLVDYRLGFKYDKTFIHVNNTDIKQHALTFGLGLPLPSNRSSFYKINLSAEIGKRGTLKNDLINDRFVNIHLGFTLNDKWFQKTYIE